MQSMRMRNGKVPAGWRAVARTVAGAAGALATWALVLGILGACAESGVRDERSDEATAGAALALGEPRLLDAALSYGVAPMMAASPTGQRAFAWVTSDSGQPTGTLQVMMEGSAPRDLPDASGAPLLDPETPPKLSYGPGGELYVLYVIATDPKNPWSTNGLRVARSPDGGATWEPPSGVGAGAATGGYRTDHGFHVAGDGSLYVAWLGDRPGVKDTVNVYVSRSIDGGRTWGPNAVVDPLRACECCRVAIASDPSGAVYVAWRKIFDGSVRDIAVARSNDRGITWSAPNRVHDDGWVVEACPDAGPALATDSARRLHVAWWTGKEGRSGAQYTRSTDGGRTFAAPVALKLAQASRAAHVQLAVRDDGAVVAAWDDGTLATPRVAVRVSRDGGATFDSLRYASTAGPAARFPVLALSGDSLTVLWHERGGAGDGGTGAGGGVGARDGIWRPYVMSAPSRVVARAGRLP